MIAAVAWALAEGGALAQPYVANALMPVTIDIIGTCTARATDLSFGSYSTNASAPLYGQTVMELKCTSGLAVEVGLDAGVGPGGSVTSRLMASGTDTLRYGLYQDAARRVNWGNTVGIDTVSIESTSGGIDTLTIFGEVPARQQVSPGQYGDVITIHVYF